MTGDYPQLIFTTENTEFTECGQVYFSSVASVLSVVTAVTSRQNRLVGNHQTNESMSYSAMCLGQLTSAGLASLCPFTGFLWFVVNEVHAAGRL
jgi:hypothetical protein